MRAVFVTALVASIFTTIGHLKADDQLNTVGWLRDACLISQRFAKQEFVDGDTTELHRIFKAGFCMGVINAEKRLRGMACSAASGKDDVIAWGIGRDLMKVSDNQLIQSFLNWSGENPQYWNDSLWEHTYFSAMFQEWQCKPKVN